MTNRAFKLDENVPVRIAGQLIEHGFDAMTIRQQNMMGAPDPQVFSVCQAEDRILVTFDLDFADIRTYRPSNSCGVIVLRPSSQDAVTVSARVERLVGALKNDDPRGQLWIVEDYRIRVRDNG